MDKYERCIYKQFDFFKEKLKNKQNFSLVRFGDGELFYIQGKDFYHKEWVVTNNNLDLEFKNLLIKSLIFNDKDYYIGLPCGCTENIFSFRKFINNNFVINHKNTTFNQIFYNNLSLRFKDEIIPIIKKFNIILISNEKSDIGSLIKKWFPVSKNLWTKYKDITNKIVDYQKRNNIKNHLFIFCAGPTSNILIYKLFNIEKKNIYLDIGSALDPMLNLNYTRVHHKVISWRLASYCYWNKKKYFQVSCNDKNISKLFKFVLKCYVLLILLNNFLISVIKNIIFYYNIFIYQPLRRIFVRFIL